MSWIHENYEKATLGAGLVCLAGLGLLGLSKMSSADDLTSYSPAIAKVQPMPGLENSQSITKNINDGHEVILEAVGEQTYHLFTGPSLWLRKGADKPAPLYDGAAVHPPVPNKWFMDRGMEQTMRKADALESDHDGDGFTNLEEFEAGTEPTDAAKHPPLINKLRIAKINENNMYLHLVLPQQGKTGIEALKGRGYAWRRTDLKPGDKFGPDESPERFLLEAVERRERKKGTMTIPDWRADFKDLSKPGEPELQLYRGDRYLKVTDLTLELQLLAGPNKGQEFTVEEGETFSLPPGGKAQFKFLSGSKKLGKAKLKDLESGEDFEIE